MSRPSPGIDEIFFAAMERESPEARAVYLEEVCGSDLELRRRVERLLEAQPRVGSFLDAPAVGPTVTLGTPTAMEGPGTVIGPYKLLEPIGEGGMGVVYMAEQSQPVRRKVALKIIKPGMDTRQVIARFEAERQALAMMDHPHIARVYDAGATDSGRPYFVMELVRGVPITEYCDHNRLSIPERLRLFAQVCQAVQHAHQKGIIHRDIKPTNVLVTSLDGAPLPKVIDFGIAKATGHSLTDKTLFTGFAQLLGTPLYMSPEQAEMSAVDVDTRSDIYSLGVLLYELLTGTTPFDQTTFKTAALDEVRRIIREQEPPRPSARLSALGATLTTVSGNRHTDPRKLDRSLRGELDWIVMKALEKERRRRYETASGLARDVERYLAGEPVEAGPPSAWYRFRKFAGRNRVVLTATSLVVLALIAGTAVSARQAIVAHRARAEAISQRDRARNAEAESRAQRDRAETNFRRARGAVDQMLTEVSESTLANVPQMEPVRRALLEKALAFYRQFLEERSHDPSIRLEVSRAAQRAGEINRTLGRHAEAEQSLRESIAMLERMAADLPDEPEIPIELAKSHTKLASVYYDTDRAADAVNHYGRAKDRLERLAIKRPGWEPVRRELFHLSLNSGGALMQQPGRLQEAEHDLRRALEIAEGLTKDFPSEPEYPCGAAGALSNLAYVAFQRGDMKGGRDHLQRALPLAKRAEDADPKNLRYLSFFMNISENLAIIFKETGDIKAAKEAMREVLPASEKRVANYPHIPQFRKDLAESFMNLGNVMGGAGERGEEEKAYRQALALLEKLTQEFPAVPGYRKDLAACLSHLCDLLISGSRPKEAVQLAEEAVAATPREQAFLLTLGVARYRAGDWKAARAALERANSLGPEGMGDPAGGFTLAMALWRLGERDPAREWYDKAVARLEERQPKDEKLLRLRAEAAALLGPTGATAPGGKERNHSK